MALIDGRTLLDNGNAVTNWGTYPADGAAPNVEGDTVKFGSASMATTADATGGGEGICYDELSDRDWTGDVVYMWVNIANPGLMEIKAAGGIRVRVANNAGIANFVEKNIEGSDTYSGGWKMFVIDMDDVFNNPDNTGGTPPVITAARYVGITVDLITGAMPKMQDNLFMDICWRLNKGTPGIRVEGQNGGNPWKWSDIVLAGDEFDGTKAWGHITESEGDIRLFSSIEFGDGAGASQTEFTDIEGRNVKFADSANPLADDIYAVTFAGNATLTTDIDFGAVVGSGDDRQGIGGTNWSTEGPSYSFDGETDIADLDTVNFYGGSIKGAGLMKFSGSTKTDLIGLSLVECGELQHNDSEFLNAFVVSPDDRGFELNQTNNTKQITCVAGSNVNQVATFGTRTNSDDGSSPANPYTFTHTVASGQEDVALLVLVGFEHTADSLLGVMFGDAVVGTFSLKKIGTISNGTTVTVEAYILYNPPEGSAFTVTCNFSAAPVAVGISAYNLEGASKFTEISIATSTASAATATSAILAGQSVDALTVDMVFADVSGPGTTFVATGGTATESRDVAVESAASYATAEDAAGLGDRDHDWTWTGSANVAQLVVSIKSIGVEHAVHLPTALDYSITFSDLQFFGFGAAGAPKWHGENSASGADVTINAEGAANPAANEFENTHSTAGTVDVQNTKTVAINVKDEAGVNLEHVSIYIQKKVPTKFTSGAGNTAGDGDLVLTQTIDSDIPQATWAVVLDRSLEGLGPNPSLSYRVASHDGANTLTFATTVSGSATSTGSGTSLVSTSTNFLTADIEEGDCIRNTTDGSFAMVDEIVDADNITTTPLQSEGAGDDTWESGDGFSVHDLATTLISGTDLVDVPLFIGQTNASGNISFSYNYSTDLDIRVRVRSNDEATEYVPQAFDGTIEVTGFARDVVLAEDTVTT